ncbi:MAG: hypothetical protein AAF438_19625 [Pseudomonadota bacterium]
MKNDFLQAFERLVGRASLTEPSEMYQLHNIVEAYERDAGEQRAARAWEIVMSVVEEQYFSESTVFHRSGNPKQPAIRE